MHVTLTLRNTEHTSDCDIVLGFGTYYKHIYSYTTLINNRSSSLENRLQTVQTHARKTVALQAKANRTQTMRWNHRNKRSSEA